METEEGRKGCYPESSQGSQILKMARQRRDNNKNQKRWHGEQVHKPVFLMTVQNLLVFFFLVEGEITIQICLIKMQLFSEKIKLLVFLCGNILVKQIDSSQWFYLILGRDLLAAI